MYYMIAIILMANPLTGEVHRYMEGHSHAFTTAYECHGTVNDPQFQQMTTQYFIQKLPYDVQKIDVHCIDEETLTRLREGEPFEAGA